MSIRRNVEGVQRKPRLLGFSIDGTGTASIVSGSTQATLVDNGTGDYTLTFTDVFSRSPICVATSLTTGVVCEIAAVSTSAVQIECFDTATGASATDADFHLMVLGYDSLDEL